MIIYDSITLHTEHDRLLWKSHLKKSNVKKMKWWWASLHVSTKGRNGESEFIQFSHAGSSRENFVVWSTTRSCIMFTHSRMSVRQFECLLAELGLHLRRHRNLFWVAWVRAACNCVSEVKQKFYYFHYSA